MRRGYRGSVLSVLVLGLVGSIGAKSAEFRNLRVDQGVPSHCRQIEMSHFNANSRVEKLTFSTLGAERKGFTNEIKITRDDAGFLYKIFRNNWHDRQNVMNRVRGNSALYQAYNLVIETEEDFDFDYRVEGEILEALALGTISRSLPNDLFVTGGITYSDSERSRILGEIDIWVAEKGTCEVVQIGEAKLNTRLLRKAKEQIRRFTNFVQNWQNRRQGDCTRFQWPWEQNSYTFF